MDIGNIVMIGSIVATSISLVTTIVVILKKKMNRPRGFISHSTKANSEIKQYQRFKSHRINLRREKNRQGDFQTSKIFNSSKSHINLLHQQINLLHQQLEMLESSSLVAEDKARLHQQIEMLESMDLEFVDKSQFDQIKIESLLSSVIREARKIAQVNTVGNQLQS